MKVIFSAVSQDEALVVKSLLESAGLSPEILAESLPVTVSLFSKGLSGLRVCVGDDEAEDAEAIVADYRAQRKEAREKRP